MELYIGFYTSPTFWTEEKPKVNDIFSNSELFEKTLSEIVCRYNDEFVNIAICRDGLLMIQVYEMEKRRKTDDEMDENYFTNELKFSSEYYRYLNTILLVLSSAIKKVLKWDYLEEYNLGSGDAFIIKMSDGKNQSSFNYNINKLNHILDRYTYYYYRSLEEFEFKNINRAIIKSSVFDTFFKDLKHVINSNEAIQMLSQVSKAVNEYKLLNFRESLVLSWFVIEYYINKKWIKYLVQKKDKGASINAKRRENLIGRDYTASIMSNILELEDYITSEIFDKINYVRSKRNNVVHNIDLTKDLADALKEKPGDKISNGIDSKDCDECFNILEYFIMTEYNLDINLSCGFKLNHL